MHQKRIAACSSFIGATALLCLVGILTAEETSPIAQDKVVGTIVIPGAKAVTCQINSDCPTGFTCAIIKGTEQRQGVCSRNDVLCTGDSECLPDERCIHLGNPPAATGQCGKRVALDPRDVLRHQR